MSGNHTTLDAASTDRKARLAKLASLKRKQPASAVASNDTPDTHIDKGQEDPQTSRSVTNVYLSGRNYDKETNGPKLGFENAPNLDAETVEKQAERLTIAANEQAAKDEADTENGIDLFKLQPKKPNWDLKRDLAERMQVLDVRTQNAIAKLVRERIESKKKEAMESRQSENDNEGEEIGIDGNSLVEGVHQREHEEEEEERRAQELENDVS